MAKVLGMLVAGAAAAAMFVQSGLVSRLPQDADDFPPYGDELRALPPYDDAPSREAPPAESYAGPGWYSVGSADGAYVAATESWGGFIGPLVGLAIDRPFIHSVGVWDARAKHFTRILSIMEADPHSGIAHRYAWSKDSKALLIHGSGRLSDNYDHVINLCIVYLPEGDRLYRLAKCPPLN